MAFHVFEEVKVLSKTSHTCFAVYEVAHCVQLHIFVHLFPFHNCPYLEVGAKEDQRNNLLFPELLQPKFETRLKCPVIAWY